MLCPSFYRAEIVQNPGRWERWLEALRQRVIAWLAPDATAFRAGLASASASASVNASVNAEKIV